MKDLRALHLPLGCGKEQFWKNGKGLWWPAGFLIFDLLKNNRSIIEEKNDEEVEKYFSAKLRKGLEGYITNPDAFEKKFSID